MMEALIGIATSLFVAIISGILLRKFDKMEKRTAKQETERNEREELTLESLNALFCVTKELVDSALYNKPPNGELKEAYSYKQETKHKLENYMRKKASRS